MAPTRCAWLRRACDRRSRWRRPGASRCAGRRSAKLRHFPSAGWTRRGRPGHACAVRAGRCRKPPPRWPVRPNLRAARVRAARWPARPGPPAQPGEPIPPSRPVQWQAADADASTVGARPPLPAPAAVRRRRTPRPTAAVPVTPCVRVDRVASSGMPRAGPDRRHRRGRMRGPTRHGRASRRFVVEHRRDGRARGRSGIDGHGSSPRSVRAAGLLESGRACAAIIAQSRLRRIRARRRPAAGYRERQCFSPIRRWCSARPDRASREDGPRW